MAGFVIQHTPVVPCDSIHWDHSHNLILELAEELSLERLGEIVRDHFLGRTVLYCNFLGGNVIGNKEVPDVNVTSSFSAGRFTVFGKFEDCALIVLVENHSHNVPLGLHKILCS
jgi:hypothetical protein